jgi:hypothetical protein
MPTDAVRPGGLLALATLKGSAQRADSTRLASATAHSAHIAQVLRASSRNSSPPMRATVSLFRGPPRLRRLRGVLQDRGRRRRVRSESLIGLKPSRSTKSTAMTLFHLELALARSMRSSAWAQAVLEQQAVGQVGQRIEEGAASAARGWPTCSWCVGGLRATLDEPRGAVSCRRASRVEVSRAWPAAAGPRPRSRATAVRCGAVQRVGAACTPNRQVTKFGGGHAGVVHAADGNAPMTSGGQQLEPGARGGRCGCHRSQNLKMSKRRGGGAPRRSAARAPTSRAGARRWAGDDVDAPPCRCSAWRRCLPPWRRPRPRRAAGRHVRLGLVGRTGVEPVTNGLKVRCSTN